VADDDGGAPSGHLSPRKGCPENRPIFLASWV
jgi:hypothetical protein